jgi:type III restriction enzyme
MSEGPRNAVDNPILNSPFEEPTRHFDFSGPQARILEGRRRSEYYGTLRSEHIGEAAGRPDAIELALVNEIRRRVAEWRARRYQGVTPTTRDLLDHWKRSDRKPLFFCQLEAVETLIWLVEGTPADLQGIDVPLDMPNDIESLRKGYAALRRYCTKMATGSGKTIVMAMVCAWSILNKLASKQDARFGDAVLVIGPNLTVKERLAVLDPKRGDNYYDAFQLVPRGYRDLLARGRVLVTNWHVLLPKEDPKRGIVQRGAESDTAFAKRILGRDLGSAGQLLVLNDEAHHAYRPAPPPSEEEKVERLAQLSSDEKREAEELAEEATVWVGGLDRIHKARGIRMVVDLSATPFYIKGSGHPEGTPLPWVVSDFGLVEAIESGITKVPRVPVVDDSGRPDPKYFHLWRTIMAELPAGDRQTVKRRATSGAVWTKAEGAFQMLAGKWEETFDAFASAGMAVPPVLIVVAANTELAKIVAESVQGGGSLQALKGEYTFGIDSRVLAEAEAAEPGGADREKERLRLKTATVGKAEWPGGAAPEGWEELTEPPGKNVRCVVSVGMLTEGWDASNVTQILGLRAFGSQLLCEQVVGRGLRRMSYDPDPATGLLVPEFCDVFGIPFEAIPVQGTLPNAPSPPPASTLVQALADRKAFALEWPRVEGFVRDVKSRLRCDVATVAPITIESTVEPASVQAAAQVGLPAGRRSEPNMAAEVRTRETFHEEHTLQRTKFEIARTITETLGPRANAQGSGEKRSPMAHRALFPQVLGIVDDYVSNRVQCKGYARVEDLALGVYRQVVVDRLLAAIDSANDDGESTLLPRIDRLRPVGSTSDVQFRTTKPVHPTMKSHISHVVLDSTWEGAVAYILERCKFVLSYAKNDRLDFTISYAHADDTHLYTPDFLVDVDVDDGRRVRLILEVKGRSGEQDRAKDTAANQWVRAVNNHGGFGRWEYRVCSDPPSLIADLERWREEWKREGAGTRWTAPPPRTTRTRSDRPASVPITPAVRADPDAKAPMPADAPAEYELLDPIAGGGMAECFRARDRATRDIVFIKRARVGSNDADALQRESDIYGRLQYKDCEHVLQVRDIRREDGFVTLVTEFADGGDLKRHVEQRGRPGLALTEALPIALEVSRGIEELHGTHIVHRDLKPENVLMVGGVWKLADFGIAKNRDNAAPGKTFQQAGTLGFAPPEQFEGTQAEPSADIYGLGKLLAYLLTGGTDIDRIRPELVEWRRLAYRCAQLSVEKRPTIGEVLEALQQLAGTYAGR